VCKVVQRIPGNRASLHNGLPSKEKADPVFPGSAAICCCCALPQELVRAIGSGFKSPLPHHSKPRHLCAARFLFDLSE
jgi:hypothetical protein